MATPLEGIKVVEMARGWAGPGAGMYLADQGAMVIKVEPPGGDDARRFYTSAPIQGEDRGFLVVNRNKRGMVVSLATERGREIVHRLLEDTDVFLENFRPGVAEKLGMDYDTLHPRHPRLIYASLSGLGARGPYSGLPAYDMVVQAFSGIMGQRHHPDGTPMNAGVWVTDCSTPMMLAYGITLALLVRERTGVGQRVETALLNQGLAMQSVELVRGEADRQRAPQKYSAQPMYSPYQCADGQWLVCVVVNNDQWHRLCRALDAEALAEDPEFDDPLKRARGTEVLYAIMSNLYASRPRDEWLEVLREADLAVAPVLRREEVFTHPQFLENDLIAEVEHPTAGKLNMMGIPVKLSETPPRTPESTVASPTLGQHTRQVLLEHGFSETDVASLYDEGIVG
ncbi:MAG: CoA transferase [Dehalococcoidia bacterium]|jgi:crotonobetainyl-CoA:carnitine CoA-transferase CaiB-like acyl-CoA transferase|nr:CoA transferase [Dehalococcoidia bacterium]